MVFLLSLWYPQHLWRGWAPRLPHLISRSFLFLSLCFILYQCEHFITATCLIWLHHRMLTLLLFLSLVTFILLVPYQSSQCFTVSGQFSILFQDGWSSDWQEKLERVQQCLHSGVFQIHFGSEMWVGTFTQSWKLQRNNSVLRQILPFMILFCICFYSLCIVFGFVSKQKLHLPGLAMSTVALVDHLVWVAETFHVFYSRWLQTTCW